MQSWPLPKDPDAVLDYQFDWSKRLETGETIASSTFISTGSITLTDETVSGAFTTFWASGGVAGEVCQVTNRITTSEGRTYDQTAKLRIRQQ